MNLDIFQTKWCCDSYKVSMTRFGQKLNENFKSNQINCNFKKSSKQKDCNFLFEISKSGL
jgi:hypothetical protein